MVSSGTFCPPNHPHISQPSIKQLIWKHRDPRNPKEWQPQTIKISKGLRCNRNETRYPKKLCFPLQDPERSSAPSLLRMLLRQGIVTLSSPVCNWTKLRYPEVKPFHLSGKTYSELGGLEHNHRMQKCSFHWWVPLGLDSEESYKFVLHNKKPPIWDFFF